MAHPQQGGGHYADDGYGHGNGNDAYYQDDQNQAYYDHNQGYGNGQDSYYDEGYVNLGKTDSQTFANSLPELLTTRANTAPLTRAKLKAKKATTMLATTATRTSTTTTNITTKVPTLQASKEAASPEATLKKTRRPSATSP